MAKRLTWKSTARRRAAIERAAAEGNCAQALRAWKKLPTEIHVAGAKRELDAAWTHLENLPPTCEGGIQRAAMALGGFARTSVHLDQISDRATRDANSNLYGMRNIGEKAAWDATQFYSRVCKAPYREAVDRPLTSRAKALEILRPKSKRKRR